MTSTNTRRLACGGALVAFALMLVACTGTQESGQVPRADTTEASDTETTQGTSPATSDQPGDPTPEITVDPDELGEFDRQLVLQLRAIGVEDAHPFEHGFRGSISSGHDDGRWIQVSTNEQELDDDAEFVRSAKIAGVAVDYVRFGRAVDALQFWCGEMHYDVRKFTGPVSARGEFDLQATEDLAERLITSIGCG